MRHGFSLVELSIVLVILGLLTGGILAGQSLIRASELRAVTSELQRYQSAVYTFRDKYFALPGDMTNATRFWGDQAAGADSCADGGITDGVPGTCNGNGDGKMAYTLESLRNWQHLAMAGLIEGTYLGNGGLMTLGTTVPRSKISNTGWGLYWTDTNGNNTANTQFPNRFIFGAVGGGTLVGAALKAEEMWNIDTKLDDGLPRSGKVWATTGAAASGTCYAATEYSLTNSGTACYFTSIAD